MYTDDGVDIILYELCYYYTYVLDVFKKKNEYKIEYPSQMTKQKNGCH